jgi:hypothetical protein
MSREDFDDGSKGEHQSSGNQSNRQVDGFIAQLAGQKNQRNEREGWQQRYE